ncbi:transposase [Celerinatantimonas diazotrophica]|uniref:Transposase n=1 Tax=Celerinatantimonas diazotrophica TaxID=412034 RepID=A0A4R1KI22_9GAMM|nr:transposase [Celerinatantimonas diazotrophica]CAG9296982.1 hypothetical protein CEDIAZO_02144 [Celerinatantimonas diazotrophica]
MKQSRFTETQIVNILKEADAGMKVEDICRKHGMSSATYYKWKSKYGGMDASELRRMKELEDENTKLKQLFAEVSLENKAMKELFAKNELITLVSWNTLMDFSSIRKANIEFIRVFIYSHYDVKHEVQIVFRF